MAGRLRLNSLRSDDFVWECRLEGLIAGMANQNRYAAWPDDLPIVPATKGPGDWIKAWLEIEPGGVVCLRNITRVRKNKIRNNSAGPKRKSC